VKNTIWAIFQEPYKIYICCWYHWHTITTHKKKKGETMQAWIPEFDKILYFIKLSSLQLVCLPNYLRDLKSWNIAFFNYFI
jgi:hypothetical protein